MGFFIATCITMGYKRKALILNKDDFHKTLRRIAHQIIEGVPQVSKICLIGIQRRGVNLAYRLKRIIDSLEKVDIPLGTIDITLYRDDLTAIGPNPEVRSTKIDFALDGKIVILVDDVLFTGRSARAALDALMDFGRPEAVKLVVLVDRGHRQLPIRADFIGKNIPTSLQEEVAVKVEEIDGKDEVVIWEKD